MKVLITGDMGFVGRAFHRALDGQDHDILGIDIVDGCDARDFFRQNRTRFDLVIHLAAVVGGRQTIEGSPLSVAVDLSIDAELVQWCLRTRPGRVIYFSSSAAYPIDLQTERRHFSLNENLIDFSNIATPDLTYGWAKLTGEYQMQFLNDEGIKVSVFRPFSGYGTDQALDYPFPSFIRRGVEYQDPFLIWGDGTQVRDFIHIDDIVAGVFAAVEQDYPEALNLGTGRATSFNELAEIVAKECGYYPTFKHLVDKPVGVHFRVADITNLSTVYQPRITLEQGVRRAIKEWK